MLNITITEHTPHNMLRAIRAACDELLGDARPYSAEDVAKVFGVSADDLRSQATPERPVAAHNAGAPIHVTEQDGREYLMVHHAVPGVDIPGPTDMLAPADADPSVERDSTGAEWNPELHASTKAKNQDGTWKKRRGAGKTEEPQVENIGHAGQVAPPSLPPLPPAPPANPLVTMNDIYALITNNKCVLNDVIAAAHAMGFADVGAFSRDATPEQRAQLLAQLTAGAGA